MNFERLEALAKKKGISKTYLCQEVDKPWYYIRDCKKQNTPIPETTITKWADILGTTSEYLTNQTEQKEKPVTEDNRLWENIRNNETKLRLASVLVQMDEEQLLQVEQILDFVLSKGVAPHPIAPE